MHFDTADRLLSDCRSNDQGRIDIFGDMGKSLTNTQGKLIEKIFTFAELVDL